MNMGIDFPKKLAAAYNAVCKPLCRELNIPQTAFDILMFLANNPDYSTAGDIVNVRKIKANLVSVNVEKLAKTAILSARISRATEENTPLADRKGSADSRAREAAPAVVFDMLFENTTDEMKKNFTETVGIIDRNLDEMLKG